MEVITDFDFADIDNKLLKMAEMYMLNNIHKADFTTYYWIDDSGNDCEGEVLPFNQHEYLFKSIKNDKILACDLLGGDRKKGYRVRVTLKIISQIGDQSGIRDVLDLPNYYCLLGFEYKARLKRFDVFLIQQSIHPTFD
jgi:hypothetical protein